MTRLALVILALGFAYLAWRNRPRYVTASWEAYNEPTYAGGSF